MEGLLHRLLDKYDPVARKCLQQAVFYVVSPSCIPKLRLSALAVLEIAHVLKL